MAISYSFHILDEGKKQLEIKYHNDTLRIQVKVKRSFTVLKALLIKFPEYLDIHSLDKTLNDPNRAHSSLKNEDGFGEFLIERRGTSNTMFVKIDIDKLFNKYEDYKNSLGKANLRENLTEQNKNSIFKKFNGKCNITRITLEQKLPSRYFFKNGIEATYDHRRPLSKGGSNKISNIQLTSVLANSEKNKICNSCLVVKCEKCALAYPEKFNIILGNNQSIEIFRK